MSTDATPLVPAGGMDRRTFVGYLIKGTTLGVALRFVGDAVLPGSAAAQVDIPEVADELDLVDLLILSGTPFYYDYLIEITPDNRVRFELPRMEVGQGIETAAVMMLAEELDCRISDVDVSLSPGEIRRSTGQITGGSHAVTSLWDPLRRVAATLRDTIVVAAAAEFGVSPTEVTTENTMAIAPDGRQLPYADLSDGVEGPQPQTALVEPKDPADFGIIGTRQVRLDAEDIVTGKLLYAMDLDVVPEANICVVARPPTLYGTVASWEENGASTLPGVITIAEVPLDVDGSSSGIAVVARSTGEAFRARDALTITWNDGPGVQYSDDDIIEELRAVNLPTLPEIPLLTDAIDAEFIFPYIAHAPMETMTAIADVSGGTARIWTGAKTPLSAQAKIARELGLLPTDVEINVIKSGGSFGRRLFFDAAVEAARISQLLEQPIKLLFTRQDDTNHGRCRPLSIHHIRATYESVPVVGTGSILSFDHRAATASLDLEHGFGDAITSVAAETGLGDFGFNQTVWHTTQLIQYDFGATSLLLNEIEYPFPVSSWRGIYSGTGMVANEIVVDELARALGEDEAEFRLRTLSDDRARAVLERVLEEGEWGRSLPAGVAQGIGLHHEYKGRVAFLVELDTTLEEPRVTRATVAVDVGRVINPTGLEAQMIGGLQDAVSVMIRTSVHIDNGAIRESSYGDLEFSRMRHSPPRLDIHILPPTQDLPGGAGELAVPAASAAIANAYARATGVTVRRFPIVDFPEGQ